MIDAPAPTPTTATIPSTPTPAPIPIRQVKGLPILGNFPEFANDRLDFLQDVFRECGDIGQFSIGSREIVLMASAELAQDVFITQAAKFEKSPMMQRLKPIIGNGLLSSKNEFHKRQ